jgi:hypothetical protein
MQHSARTGLTRISGDSRSSSAQIERVSYGIRGFELLSRRLARARLQGFERIDRRTAVDWVRNEFLENFP